MRPAEYSSAQIVAAGQALQAEGRRTTSFALRQRLGGGNPIRLKAIWDEHLTSQTQAPAQLPDLPPEIAEQVSAINARQAEQLNALAKQLSASALALVEQRTADAVLRMQQAREQVDAELEDATRVLDESLAALNDAKAKAQGLQAELEAAQKRLHDQELAMAKQEGELSAMKARYAELIDSLSPRVPKPKQGAQEQPQLPS